MYNVLTMTGKKKREKVVFTKADDIHKSIKILVKKLGFDYIRGERVFCVRSTGSKARAYARIWGLSRIFQEAAGMKPTYIIEVLSERFDCLDARQQQKVLIHELLHIPKTFSGALKPHRGRYHRVDRGEVERLFSKL